MAINASVILTCMMLPFFGTPTQACTGFCVSHENVVLVGNNEDWKDRNTKVWFVPGSGGDYGRVLFGYGFVHPQGGMNEKGLCFDGFATRHKKAVGSRDKPDFEGPSFLDHVLANCSTVREVLEEFDAVNLEHFGSSMWFFADATGDSVIIEGDNVVRKDGPFQVVTNFRQSETEEASCWRYLAANAILEDADDITIELARRILDATHQEGAFPTVYSNIYDLRNKEVHLYHFHDFENVVVLTLANELKKGPRRMNLPDLFE